MHDKPGVPEFWGKDRPEEQARKNAQVTNQLQKGQGNNSFAVDLREGETTTEVLISFAKSNQIGLVTAQDSETSTETIWVEMLEGKAVIHHGSSTGTRKVGLAVFG